MIEHQISLIVGERAYSGWTSIQVSAALDTGTGEFEAEVSEVAAADQRMPPSWSTWRIKPDDDVRITYNGQTAFTGVVDTINPSYDAYAHGVRIKGRSKTRDIVDSSAVLDPGGEMKDGTLLDLARSLIKGYPINVEGSAAALMKFPRASVLPGETVQATLERYARSAGVFVTDTAAGNLRLVEIDETEPVASLVEGRNILSARGLLKSDTKHSRITVKGQAAGTDEKHGIFADAASAFNIDPIATRHRPLVVVDEAAGDKEALKSRADWEQAVRTAESMSATVEVVGWTHRDGGALWWPGDMMWLSSTMLRIERIMGLKSMRLSQDDSVGTRAELSLVLPQALRRPAKRGQQSGVDVGATDTLWRAAATPST